MYVPIVGDNALFGEGCDGFSHTWAGFHSAPATVIQFIWNVIWKTKKDDTHASESP
jgi:hypothetical protein